MNSAWLVYRMREYVGDSRRLKILGLYKTKEAAEKDVETMDDDDWEITEALFIGWGILNA